MVEQTNLITWCEVCFEQKTWMPIQERWILYASHMVCPRCRQTTQIPTGLKQDIKKRLGMFNG